jgi:hypothetical protein
MNLLHEIIKGLPPPLYKAATHASSLLLGVVLAILLNYALYRLGLPSKPFIYVAF